MSNSDYDPIIVKLPQIKDNILNTEPNVIRSGYQAQPLFKYGFHHYIHATKDKMEILETTPELKGKKFYLVTNPFEHEIKDYDESISIASNKYFKTDKNKPEILSRAFYKLWEIIMYFELIPETTKKMTIVNLAEGPGSFIQCIMNYRDKFFGSKDTLHDKIYAITIYGNIPTIPQLSANMVNYYTKQKKLQIFKTYPPDTARKSKEQSDGDLTNIKTINLFKNMVLTTDNKHADLITADGGLNWNNENFQEQEAYGLILGEILTALNLQAKGGNFVCKFFETFTTVSVKYLCILQYFYEDIYICKPFTSRPSNSERYVIATKFKYQQTNELSKKIGMIDKILYDITRKDGLFVNDIFTSFKVPADFETTVLHVNSQILNIQHTNINKIMNYINEKNYFGDDYHKYKDEQINASTFWIKTFLPITKRDIKLTQQSLENKTRNIIKKNETIIQEKLSKLDKLIEEY